MPELTEKLKPPPADAGPGHNSAGFVEMVREDPMIVFRDPEIADGFLSEMETEVSQLTPVVTSKKGRDAIAALAYSISRAKTAVDNAGKGLNEDHRKAILKVDTVRKKLREGLDALRDKVRQPLNEWEDAEKAREERINSSLRLLNTLSRPPAGVTANEIAATIEELCELECSDALYGDRAEEIASVRDRVIETLTTTHATVKRAEDAQAELAQIKAEQAEKERIEAEARAKADAEEAEAKRAQDERQRQEAERQAVADKAAEEARAQERAEAEARERAAEEVREAERREAARIAAEAEAAQRAEVEKAQAEAKAAADALAAKEREEADARARAEAEAAETARRQADAAHRERVIANAVDAIIRQTSLSDGEARAVINTIAAGQVPAVSIHF